MPRKKIEYDVEKFIKTLDEKKGDYVPNGVLLAELKKCKELGRVTDDCAKMFVAIASRLSNKLTYKTPEDKEDCVQRAVLDCLKYWDRFDPDKGENPFSYFTTVCTNGLGKGWEELGYTDLPHSMRVSLSASNIYSI